jgi:hypothetical protein
MSLFARATASPTPKRVRGFLGLPGELRNLIYHYYFQQEFRVEIAAKGAEFAVEAPRTIKLCLGTVNRDGSVFKYQPKPKKVLPMTLRMHRQHGHQNRVDGLRTNWATSLSALVLVCKQVHAEAIVFLYQNTTFVFNAPKRIINFLGIVSKNNQANITKLQLHYSTYGHPRLVEMQKWKRKHGESWHAACISASKRLVHLQALEVHIHVNTHTKFDLREDWVQPLLHFRRLTCAGRACGNQEKHCKIHNLGIVKIHLQTRWRRRWTPSNVLRYPELEDACDDLHSYFSQTLELAIHGFSEETALAEFKEAWNGRAEYRWLSPFEERSPFEEFEEFEGTLYSENDHTGLEEWLESQEFEE